MNDNRAAHDIPQWETHLLYNNRNRGSLSHRDRYHGLPICGISPASASADSPAAPAYHRLALCFPASTFVAPSTRLFHFFSNFAIRLFSCVTVYSNTAMRFISCWICCSIRKMIISYTMRYRNVAIYSKSLTTHFARLIVVS